MIDASLDVLKLPFSRLARTAHASTEMWSCKSDNTTWGKSKAKIHCAAKYLLAYLNNHCSNERLSKHRMTEGPRCPRNASIVEGTRSTLVSAVIRFPNPIANRLFQGWQCWVGPEPDANGIPMFTFAFVDISSYPGEKPPGVFREEKSPNLVRGRSSGLYLIKELSSNVCEYTLIQSYDVGGSVPSWIIDFKLRARLSRTDEIRTKFERNGNVVDIEMRASFIQRVKSFKLDRDQTEIVKRCLSLNNLSLSSLAESPSPGVLYRDTTQGNSIFRSMTSYLTEMTSHPEDWKPLPAPPLMKYYVLRRT